MAKKRRSGSKMEWEGGRRGGGVIDRRTAAGRATQSYGQYTLGISAHERNRTADRYASGARRLQSGVSAAVRGRRGKR